jgi:hypothetical protein
MNVLLYVRKYDASNWGLGAGRIINVGVIKEI